LRPRAERQDEVVLFSESPPAAEAGGEKNHATPTAAEPLTRWPRSPAALSGALVGDLVEVLESLTSGERVVNEGSFFLRTEAARKPGRGLTRPQGPPCMLPSMTHERLLVGELARKAGTTRKALRIYEAAGLLPPARRTPSGYRVYTSEALPLLAFILKARRIGFSVAEIKSIVGLRRSGQAPCRHVHDLVRRKAADVERALTELTEVRKALLGLLRSWPSRQQGPATVCRHIEKFQRLEVT